jgi:hypothetical protein
MKLQLFRPFRIGQWTRLAFVGLLAGELSSGNSCNFGSHSGASSHGQGWPGGHIDPALIIPVAILFALIVPVVLLIFLYISSRMRFVLFDSIVAKKSSVRQMWRARSGPAFYLFVWQIVFFLIAFIGFGLIIGIPALFAFANGWFKQPKEHLAPLVLAGVIVFFVFLAWMFLAAVVHVFTKDFVVPQMALENISAFEGWSRLLKMLAPEKGRYVIYALLKVALAIGAAIAVGIAGFILLLLLLIPLGGVGVMWVMIGRAAGLSSWNLVTITLAIVAGCVLLFVLLYVLSLVAVPVIVFFPAYSIYFFADRYPPLARLVNPTAPPTPSAPLPQPA